VSDKAHQVIADELEMMSDPAPLAGARQILDALTRADIAVIELQANPDVYADQGGRISHRVPIGADWMTVRMTAPQARKLAAALLDAMRDLPEANQ